MNSANSEIAPPKRKSSLYRAPTAEAASPLVKRSSMSSLIDRTKSAALGRLGRKPVQLQEQKKTPSLRPVYDDEENEEATPKVHQLASEYFGKYEIMTEFINLRNPSHCPLGMYVAPSEDDFRVWYGVLFVNKGIYKTGTFKFRLNIPERYPNEVPTVTFLTDMFHPLVDVHGNVSISQQFPMWRPYQDYIFHILHYLKNMFKKVVLDGLNNKYCFNKEAYRLYRTDTSVFGKLAQQCAQLSITESYIFDHFPDNNTIHFSPLSDAQFDELKAKVLHTAISPIELLTTDNNGDIN